LQAACLNIIKPTPQKHSRKAQYNILLQLLQFIYKFNTMHDKKSDGNTDGGGTKSGCDLCFNSCWLRSCWNCVRGIDDDTSSESRRWRSTAKFSLPQTYRSTHATD